MSHMDNIAFWIQSLYPTIPVVIVPLAGETDDTSKWLDGPAPSGDYITLFDMSSKGNVYTNVEKEAIDGDPNNVKYTSQNHTLLRVSVNAYHPDGMEILHNIECASDLPPVRLSDDTHFRPIVADSGDVRNLAFLDDTAFKPRYQCEFTFRVSYIREVIDPKVRRVEITGTFSEMDSEVIVE